MTLPQPIKMLDAAGGVRVFVYRRAVESMLQRPLLPAHGPERKKEKTSCGVFAGFCTTSSQNTL